MGRSQQKRGTRVKNAKKPSRHVLNASKSADGRGIGLRYWIVLALIFIVCSCLRIYLAYQAPYYSDDLAYFSMRQVESIQETGFPIFNDTLSFQGRLAIFSPLFHYFLAFFGLFLPSAIVFKVIPNLLAASVVVIIFLITYEITRSGMSALASSALSAFVPVYIKTTINSVSVLSLVVPLIFYLIYCYMRIEEDLFMNQFIILIFILPLIHSTAFLFIIGLVFYIFLAKLQGLRLLRKEIEVILFSLFLIIWVEFLIFKKAFLFHGIHVIWQNVPPQVLDLYFQQISFFEILGLIGGISFVIGAYTIYRYLFTQKNKDIYLVGGFTLSVAILLWLRLIKLETGLVFFGLVLTILVGLFFGHFDSAVRKTRFAGLRYIGHSVLIILILATTVFPSYVIAQREILDSTTEAKISALEWARDSLPQDATLVSMMDDGHKINHIAKRKNILDSNFLLIEDAKIRYADLTDLFTTMFKTEAIMIFGKYDAEFIMMSPRAAGFYGIEGLRYVDEVCFEEVYDEEGIIIYQNRCTLEPLEKNGQKE
ncbi:hypothetical protein JW968_07000 [Candidatus Woesearchaeota archaeon]|nr:hypothetical protein [Candidatus Woesearchaeota archaeon]